MEKKFGETLSRVSTLEAEKTTLETDNEVYLQNEVNNFTSLPRLNTFCFLRCAALLDHLLYSSDVDPVGSEFIWVRGSGSRGIKWREKQS